MSRGQSQRQREMESRFRERALEVWQTRSRRNLTCEDLREIAENATGFFRILLGWETKERACQERKFKKIS